MRFSLKPAVVRSARIEVERSWVLVLEIQKTIVLFVCSAMMWVQGA